MFHPSRFLSLLSLFFSLVPVAIAHAQGTALHFDSEPGDYIGGGGKQTWTSSQLQFVVTISSDRQHVQVRADPGEFSGTWWSLDFSAPSGSQLGVGIFNDATRYPFQPLGGNGLDVSGSGRGCNTLYGRFQIYEFDVDDHGVLRRFAADFEQHCEGATPALFGAVRYFSTRASLIPFDGRYPLFGLQITPAVNGYVITPDAPGINCGAGRTDCAESYARDALVSLEAVPSPGYVFLGWLGYACAGTYRAQVRVRWLMSCTPIFSAVPGTDGVESPDYSAEAVFLDGHYWFGHDLPVDVRKRVVHAPPHVDVLVTSATSDAVTVMFRGIQGDFWRLTFGAPEGSSLTPGTYESTSQYMVGRGDRPALEISGSSGCSDGGRFVIYESELSAGAVSRFSADFEASCGFPVRPLAGSVRYRATRSTLLPFDGAYPRYLLSVRATLGGYITTTGIACGDGDRSDCIEEYLGETAVSLEAHPSPGYEFLAWSDVCSGSSPLVTIVLDRSQTCLAMFHPSPGSDAVADPSFGVAALFLDWSGPPASHRELLVHPAARVSFVGPGAAVIGFEAAGRFTTVSFNVPVARLTPGEYDVEYPRTSVSMEGCTLGYGRFQVYQAEYNSLGRLVAFAADFEGHCTSIRGFDEHEPFLYVAGAVRFNSSRTTLVPFEGAYPRYRLRIAPSSGGTVVGQGIDCGASANDCTEEFHSIVPAALEAIPSAGYRFAGWTDDCEGAASTTVHMTRSRRCEAVFAAIRPASLPQDARLSANAVLLHSHPGDRVGEGRRILLLNSQISAEAIFDPATRTRTILQALVHDYLPRWSLWFETPAGKQLAPGVYENAGAWGLRRPAILVGRATLSPFCTTRDTVSGRFTIHEITFDPVNPGTITALALDFEQRCTPTSPPLRGSIRINSSRTDIRPYLSSRPSPVRFDLNADGYVDLLWQHGGDGRLMSWQMSGVAHFFDEPLEPGQVPDTNWHVVGDGDANRDGFTDLFWQHQTTGELAVWYMRGQVMLGGELLTPSSVPDTNWKVRSVADMNRDGYPDLIWQHVGSGDVAVWFMNNLQQLSGQLVGRGPVTDLNWTIVGAGDVNRDGWTDLLWHHVGTGQIAVWFMQGATMLSGELLSPAAVPDTDWRVRGVADLDQNGYPDLLWQHLSTLDVAVWFMQGRQLIDGRLVEGPALVDPAWHLVAPK